MLKVFHTKNGHHFVWTQSLDWGKTWWDLFVHLLLWLDYPSTENTLFNLSYRDYGSSFIIALLLACERPLLFSNYCLSNLLFSVFKKTLHNLLPNSEHVKLSFDYSISCSFLVCYVKCWFPFSRMPPFESQWINLIFF